MEELSNSKHQLIADISFILGATILILIAAILLISSLLFAACISISQYNFILASLVTAIAAWLLCSRHFPTRKLTVFVLLMFFLTGILVSGIYAAGRIYDVSVDGQAYHQKAVIQLATGWNPFRDEPLQTINSLWINHYAKGPWITSSSLYALTGRIEQGKVFNILLIIASLFICLSALIAHFQQKLFEPLLLSLLAAGNPVSILQSMSFYNDGQLASLLVIVLALLYLVIVKKDRVSLTVLVLSLIIAINIKFTALAYVLVICALVLCYLLFQKRTQLVKQISYALAISLITGILLVGYNPYVTNTISKGHPFYPLAGPNAVDIMTVNSPASFHFMNRFEKLFISIFSMTENIAGHQTTHWKWPFTVAEQELSMELDNRIAGFGPLFGGSILLSLILFIAALSSRAHRALPYAGLLLLIVLSALVNPEAWWARYAPQIWLLPVTCIMLGMDQHGKIYRVLAPTIALVLCLNLSLVSFAYFNRLHDENSYLKNQLAEMKTAGIVLVKFKSNDSTRVRLDEAGIRYKEVKQLDGPDVKTLAFSDTLYRKG